MKGIEALAIIGTTAFISGGTAAYIELQNEAEARGTAITAQACLDTYGTDKNGNISQATLNCLKNGWVPGGNSAAPDFKAGDPNGLYVGYIKQERSKGSHLDVAPILAFTAGGLAVGLWVAYKMEQDEAPAETKPEPAKHAIKPTVNGNSSIDISK